MNKRLYFFCALLLTAAVILPGFIASAAEADEEINRRLAAKVKIKLSVSADAFNYDAKEKTALGKKIENYLMTAILKNTAAAFVDKNCDADISVRFKVAAAFSKNEEDLLCVLSVAASAAASYQVSGGGPSLSIHELFCLRMCDLNKNCSLIASMVNENILSAVKDAKKIAAARRAAEEKKRRAEYELALKKQNEIKKAEEIKAWKAQKYQQWKSNKSMSILDEELEAAGITFEQLLKEFKEMDGR